MCHNSALSELDLDFSENQLGKVVGETLANNLRGNTNIQQLRLANNKLDLSSLSLLLSVLAGNSTMKGLDIGGNIKPRSSKNSKNFEIMLQNLGAFLTTNTSVQTLHIAGNGKECYLGKDIVSLLKIIGESSSLTRLNVSDNKFGDEALIQLAEALRTNTTLKTINWDGNNTSISGWQSFVRIFRENKTLVSVMFVHFFFSISSVLFPLFASILFLPFPSFVSLLF